MAANETHLLVILVLGVFTVYYKYNNGRLLEKIESTLLRKHAMRENSQRNKVLQQMEEKQDMDEFLGALGYTTFLLVAVTTVSCIWLYFKTVEAKEKRLQIMTKLSDLKPELSTMDVEIKHLTSEKRDLELVEQRLSGEVQALDGKTELSRAMQDKYNAVEEKAREIKQELEKQLLREEQHKTEVVSLQTENLVHERTERMKEMRQAKEELDKYQKHIHDLRERQAAAAEETARKVQELMCDQENMREQIRADNEVDKKKLEEGILKKREEIERIQRQAKQDEHEAARKLQSKQHELDLKVAEKKKKGGCIVM